MADHLSFLQEQAAHIEPGVYRHRYGNIRYPSIIPVDTSAPDYTRTILHYTSNGTGRPEFMAPDTTNVPLVDVERDQHVVTVEMATIGYRYNFRELELARAMGRNLGSERAMVAREEAEKTIDQLVLDGDSAKKWDGLLRNSNVTRLQAEAANGERAWRDKTPLQILDDINDLVTEIYSDSLQIEMANTLLMPIKAFAYLANTPVSDLATETILQFIRRANVYSAETGRPLMIRSLRGLESAGNGGDGRMIAYMREPTVLKLHMPMAFRFFPAFQVNPFQYLVAGAFALGGLEVRRPGAMRYLDSISPAP